VFGICDHGKVGMLDSLYQAKDKIKLVSPRTSRSRAHGRRLFRVRHEAVATLTSCGPLRQYRDPVQVALSIRRAAAITANVPTQQFIAPVPGGESAL